MKTLEEYELEYFVTMARSYLYTCLRDHSTLITDVWFVPRDVWILDKWASDTNADLSSTDDFLSKIDAEDDVQLAAALSVAYFVVMYVANEGTTVTDAVRYMDERVRNDLGDFFADWIAYRWDFDRYMS